MKRRSPAWGRAEAQAASAPAAAPASTAEAAALQPCAHLVEARRQLCHVAARQVQAQAAATCGEQRGSKHACAVGGAVRRATGHGTQNGVCECS